MTSHKTALSLALAFLLVACQSHDPVGSPDASSAAQLEYPVSKTVEQVDTYHNTEVPDPYRWLEDLDSADTRAWVKAQNEVTFGYLESIPQRSAIRKRLTQLWNYEKYGLPRKRGGRYFFSRNDGLQNQSVLYTLDSLEGQPRELLDPNLLSSDGTVALTRYVPSDDGRRLAYGLSNSGSDWQEWKIRDVESGEDLSDHLKWIKFSGVSWTPDSKGFFYSRYDEPPKDGRFEEVNYYQKLYYHVVGTPQAEDVLVYERRDQKEWGFNGTVTDDGRYLIISIRQGTDPRNRLFYKGLQLEDAPVVELLNEFDAAYDFIDNDGPVLWLHTDLQAPRGRVIAVDTTRPGREHWKEIVPEAEETLVGVSVVRDTLIARYLKDAHTLVKLFRLDGSLLRTLELPGLGTASGFGGKRADTETFFSFSSFNTPGVVYRLDLERGDTSVFRRPELAFQQDEYVTRQIFYHSADGTRVPMFVNHRKGLKLDGNNPTILYGYGGFNIPITPRFSPSRVVWMEMGGVFAVANLRGGGEYGEEWHEAGTKLKKQNVFDDFIAAAEWLMEHEYTSTPKLSIEGGSNGGLLVGACMTQRPDLFGAALPAVGVMDMLRFPTFTIGWAWTSDFGSPDNPEEFKALLAYSPLHNLKQGTGYPATLITTADHDDRVVPAHSFKFAAALQAAHQGPDPVLIRIETKAGHGAGKPTSKRIEEAADRLAFLVKVLGISPQIALEPVKADS